MKVHEVVTGLQLAVRASIAAGISVGLATLFQLDYPIYALVAAVIVTDFSPAETRRLGVLRLIATVIGAAVGGCLRSVLEPNPFTIGLSILVAMAMCQSRLRGTAKVAGFISGIVMLDHGHNVWSYAFYRFIETALGIAVAWQISFVPKLIRLPEPDSGVSPPSARP